MHVACDKGDKEVILLLIMSGADANIKNKQNSKPSDGNMDLKTFVNNIIAEEKAFNALNNQQKNKLTEIFNEIVSVDSSRTIDLKKSIRFNRFIEDTVSPAVAEKDANDFLKSCAICNKETVTFSITQQGEH